MIAYVLLALGCGGTAAVAYAVAPAGRGLHRYVVPRAALRAEAARNAATAEELACKVVGLASEYEAAATERDDLRAALEQATLRIAELSDQARDVEQLRESNTALKAALANAHPIRPLPLPAAADDVSSLPDDEQEFASTAATAWRAGA